MHTFAFQSRTDISSRYGLKCVRMCAFGVCACTSGVGCPCQMWYGDPTHITCACAKARTCARRVSTNGTKGKNNQRDALYMNGARFATCGVDRSYLRDADCFVAIAGATVIAMACSCTRKSHDGYERRCLLDAATICVSDQCPLPHRHRRGILASSNKIKQNEQSQTVC